MLKNIGWLLIIIFLFTGCVTVPVVKKKTTIPSYHYYLDLEDYENAIKSAREFIAQNPDHASVPEALLIIGKSNTRLGVQFRLNRYPLAKNEYAVFLKFYEEAAQAYRRIVTDYPESKLAPIAQLYLGKMYDIDPYGGLNLFDKALEEYRKVIELYPDSDAAQRAKERIDTILNQ